MEMKMTIIGKISKTFQLFTLKLGHTQIFMKIWEKEDRKLKMKMKKFWKTSTIFKFTTLKSAYISIFKKIWEKTFQWFLTNGGKNKDDDDCKISKTLHPKIRRLSNFLENLREKNVLSVFCFKVLIVPVENVYWLNYGKTIK